MKAVDELTIQKSRGQEASTSDGAGTPSFQHRNRMNYPFEQRFIFAVENIDLDENAWLCLIRKESPGYKTLLNTLIDNGYTKQFVQESILSLTSFDTDSLINLAMLPDYRSEPALAALRTRATEEVFSKAQTLSQSSLNTKRVLAVKILNSEHQMAFIERTKSLLKALNSKETDDLVIEQLGYAFSKLQID